MKKATPWPLTLAFIVLVAPALMAQGINFTMERTHYLGTGRYPGGLDWELYSITMWDDGAHRAGGDEPTIGDVTALIDALFVSEDPSQLQCLSEADVNQSGGLSPDQGDITIGDVSYLIDYLFITGTDLGLPECM